MDNYAIECPCCSMRRVKITNVNRCRSNNHSVMVGRGVPLASEELTRRRSEGEAMQGDYYCCTSCGYDWLEAIYYVAENVRIVHITYGLAEELSCTMRIRWEDALGIGLEEEAGVDYLLGREAADYTTWYQRLLRQREYYRRRVRVGA